MSINMKNDQGRAVGAMCSRVFFTAVGLTMLGAPALSQIEAGLSVGFRDFAVLPNSTTGNDAPARTSVMTADPLGRLFVNDQRGPLYTITADGNTVTPYLDIDAIAGVNLDTATGERGFQSFAFHPDFNNAGTAGFGKFYTLHSDTDRNPPPTFAFFSNTSSGSSNTLDTVLLEWSVNDPTANTYSAAGGTAPRQVMRFEQPFGNHNGGLIAFNTSAGPASSDRNNLYVALGDGGSSNDPWSIARDPASPYGKILRIDPTDPDGNGSVTYSAAAGNVFATDGDANTLAEVYAYGLRNPQRFGWDDNTGQLYVADIGQNAFEEINLLANGGNFGWGTEEGNSTPADPNLIDPIAAYNHGSDIPAISGATSGRAITVGEVVRGTGIPGLDGLLLTGDFPTGTPLAIDVSAGLPAEGSGVTPFSELILVDVQGDGQAVKLLDLINTTRAATGLAYSNRADLRWSLGVDGRVFLLNKKDGVIRELIAIPEPTAFLMLLGLTSLALVRRRLI